MHIPNRYDKLMRELRAKRPRRDKRPWHQFSLKTLLIAVTLFTVTVGWIGSKIHWARKNRDRVAAVERAVTEIEGLGGEVTEHLDQRPQTWLEMQFDDPGRSSDPVRNLQVKVVNLVLSDVTDSDVKNLTTLTNFASLELNGKSVTQADLQQLKGAANRARTNRQRLATEKAADVDVIEKLGGTVWYGYEKLRPQTLLEELLDDPGDSDDPVRVLKVSAVHCCGKAKVNNVLMHVAGLEDLTFLNLYGPRITDAGLEHLRALTSLRWLHLRNTKVTDAGLEHLKGLTNLKKLLLLDTNVTDAGLEHLRELTNLNTLLLEGTNVTDAGVEKLQRELPQCKISH